MEKEERGRRKKSKMESFDAWERWLRGRDKGEYFGAWRERAVMVAWNLFVHGRDKNSLKSQISCEGGSVVSVLLANRYQKY
jgi:hypothetical protein